MSDLAREARDRAIEAFTSAAMRAAQPAGGTTASAAAKYRAVRALIEEGCDELLVAATTAREFAVGPDGVAEERRR